MSFRQKVLSGLIWTGSARLLSQIFTWAITLVVIRLLTPADYGLLAMATVFMGFLSVMGEAGLGAAVVQARELDDQQLRAIFAAVVLVDLLLFVVQYAAAPAISWFFDEERLTTIIRVLALQFFLSMLTVIPSALLARRMDFKRQSVIGFVAAIAGSVSSLMMALAGYGVWALVVGNIVAQVCSTAGLLWAAPYLKWPDFSMKGARELIVFGGQLTGSRVLWFLYSQADIFIAGKMLGRETLGFYSVAMHLASLPVQRISAVINHVAFPAFAQVQRDREAVGHYLRKSVRLLSFVSFPVLWGISSVAPELVAVVLGDKWKSAALPLQTIALIMPVSLLSPFFNSAFQGLGLGGVVFRNVLTASVLMPAAFLIGVQWGLAGLSLAWLIGFPLVFLLNLSRMLPLVGLGLGSMWVAMASSLLSGVVMYAAVTAGRELLGPHLSAPVLMASLVAIGVVVYAIMAFSVNRNTVDEILELLPRGG